MIKEPFNYGSFFVKDVRPLSTLVCKIEIYCADDNKKLSTQQTLF
jgi:hypothetical protein